MVKCLLVEEGLDNWWEWGWAGEGAGHNWSSNGTKGQQSEESESTKGGGRGQGRFLFSLGSLYQKPPENKASGGCRGRDKTPPKALRSLPQIGGHSLVADLSQTL